MRMQMVHVQDPHFKTANHRRRIIQTSLLAEYAYCLAVGGMLYTITDVPELGEWMKTKLDAHPLFQRCADSNLGLLLNIKNGNSISNNRHHHSISHSGTSNHNCKLTQLITTLSSIGQVHDMVTW